MLKITEDDAHDCLILEPSGSLNRSDIDRLTERFNDMVNATGRVPNLVVHAPGFPGWRDFGTMLKHLRFIREHHKLIRRIALVTDGRILEYAPKIARYFVAAEVRQFPPEDLDGALAWVAETQPRTSGVTVIEGLPDDVVGISVDGMIGASDYAATIVPLIEAKLARHDKIKMIYRIGPGFEAFTPGAVWADARFGTLHLAGFSKVAVLSDIGWIRHSVRLFAPLIPAEVHVFGADDLDAAKAWVLAA